MRAIIFILLLSLSQTAWAVEVCTCKDRKETVEQEYDRAFGVFVGTVRKLRRDLDQNKMTLTFRVEQSWKGIRGKEVQINTYARDLFGALSGKQTCGYPFEQGERYVVFAHRPTRKGLAWVSRCSFTRRADQAESLIPKIEALAATGSPRRPNN